MSKEEEHITRRWRTTSVKSAKCTGTGGVAGADEKESGKGGEGKEEGCRMVYKNAEGRYEQT